MNGHRSVSIFFVIADSFLILAGVFAGIYLRFWGNGSYPLEAGNLTFKILFLVLVVQLLFYYFDLYNLRIFSQKLKMAILFLESLGISSVILAFSYYLIPSLTMGRGIFVISLLVIFVLSFLWRLLYGTMLHARVFKERILIIGTGELAKKITKEIAENGNGGVEIVGFIDERSN